MSDIIYNVASALFFISAIRSILFWLYLWQLKEYRLDRLFSHLRGTSAGGQILFNPLEIVKNISMAFFLAATIYSWESDALSLFVIFLFFITVVEFVKELFFRKARRPKITFKTTIIGFLSLFVIVISYLIPFIYPTYWLLLLDRIVVVIVAIFVGFMWFPSEFVKELLLHLASARRLRYKNLVVIGVTGSYGKSSTKEYIYKLLSSKYRVIVSPGGVNTPVGLSRFILSNLNSKVDILILEMGAYKKGEIAQMCDAFKPTIGVLTGIGLQHLSLFGGIENIKRAKYELVEHLPYNSLALFNGNSEYLLDLFNNTKRRTKILYGGDNKLSSIYATGVKIKKFSTEFRVHVDHKISYNVAVPLIGSQTVEHSLAAIYLAHQLGIEKESIKNSLLSVTLPDHRMRPFKDSLSGAVLVDDTYNASPDSVKAALSYAKIFTGQVYMVFSPIIELGKDSRKTHFEIGGMIGKVCSKVFVTNKSFYKEISKGVEGCGRRCNIFLPAPENTSVISEKLKPSDVVLFIGREAYGYLKKFDYA